MTGTSDRESAFLFLHSRADVCLLVRDKHTDTRTHAIHGAGDHRRRQEARVKGGDSKARNDERRSPNDDVQTMMTRKQLMSSRDGRQRRLLLSLLDSRRLVEEHDFPASFLFSREEPQHLESRDSLADARTAILHRNPGC